MDHDPSGRTTAAHPIAEQRTVATKLPCSKGRDMRALRGGPLNDSESKYISRWDALRDVGPTDAQWWRGATRRRLWPVPWVLGPEVPIWRYFRRHGTDDRGRSGACYGRRARAEQKRYQRLAQHAARRASLLLLLTVRLYEYMLSDPYRHLMS